MLLMSNKGQPSCGQRRYLHLNRTIKLVVERSLFEILKRQSTNGPCPAWCLSATIEENDLLHLGWRLAGPKASHVLFLNGTAPGMEHKVPIADTADTGLRAAGFLERSTVQDMVRDFGSIWTLESEAERCGRKVLDDEMVWQSDADMIICGSNPWRTGEQGVPDLQIHCPAATGAAFRAWSRSHFSGHGNLYGQLVHWLEQSVVLEHVARHALPDETNRLRNT